MLPLANRLNDQLHSKNALQEIVLGVEHKKPSRKMQRCLDIGLSDCLFLEILKLILEFHSFHSIFEYLVAFDNSIP